MSQPGDRQRTGTQRDERVRSLEAVLFVADEPIPAASLAQVLESDRHTVERLLEELASEYQRSGSGLALRKIAGGWRLYTHSDTAAAVERFVLSSRHSRLTKASLETLAIVAYKQPVTRHQVAAIRGVDTEGVLKALVARGLLAEVGHDQGPGRPILYGTTPQFLERLGLDSIADLPSLAPLLGSGDDGGDDESEDSARAGPASDSASEADGD
ncbi:MAG: SMC-Scp complex subunit ScpB [Actinomycetota bacterium]